MGAWIEISIGLIIHILDEKVAPLVGAWIEIKVAPFLDHPIKVAPLVGAWIEIGTKI